VEKVQKRNRLILIALKSYGDPIEDSTQGGMANSSGIWLKIFYEECPLRGRRYY
jgi:hypothetical protein